MYLEYENPSSFFVCFSFHATLYFYLMNALWPFIRGKNKVAQNEKQIKTTAWVVVFFARSFHQA